MLPVAQCPGTAATRGNKYVVTSAERWQTSRYQVNRLLIVLQSQQKYTCDVPLTLCLLITTIVVLKPFYVNVNVNLWSLIEHTFQPLEVVDRGSETEPQVVENLNK